MGPGAPEGYSQGTKVGPGGPEGCSQGTKGRAESVWCLDLADGLIVAGCNSGKIEVKYLNLKAGWGGEFLWFFHWVKIRKSGERICDSSKYISNYTKWHCVTKRWVKGMCFLQGKFTKRVREMESLLFVTLFSYTIYLSLCTQTAETTSSFRTLFVNSPVLEWALYLQVWNATSGELCCVYEDGRRIPINIIRYLTTGDGYQLI